jgi:hypothetical protein
VSRPKLVAEISTSREEPVKVMASYYSQKERKNKLRKKKRPGFYPVRRYSL